MTLLHTKTVTDFVTEIRTELENANKSWMQIAHRFAEAEEMFGGKSDEPGSDRSHVNRL